jgi:hypothetical protein
LIDVDVFGIVKAAIVQLQVEVGGLMDEFVAVARIEGSAVLLPSGRRVPRRVCHNSLRPFFVTGSSE